MKIATALVSAALVFVSLARAEDAKPPAPEAAKPAAAPAAPLSFSRHVAPILVKNCQACHGPREAKGDYQVTTFEHFMKPGESGTAPVTAGKPDESELFNLISSEDPDSRMPKDGDPLAAADVALIKQWIVEGAKFDGPSATTELTALVPRAAQPDPPATYRRPFPVTSVAFSPDGQELAVGGYREVTIWNATSGVLLRRIKNVAERTYGLCYSPDGTLLATASGTPGQLGEVKLFSPVDGKLVRELGTMSDVAFRAVFSADGKKLAACGADRTIRIYDVATGNQDRIIEDHADWVLSIAWNADGTRLASASRDKTSKLFNAQTGESLVTYTGHGEQVFGAGFGLEKNRVYTAGGDKKIHAWRQDDAAKVGEVGGFSRELLNMITDGELIFSCSADRSVQQHRAKGLKHVRTYSGHQDAVYALAYHDKSKRLASGDFAGQVRVWDADKGASLLTFVAAPGLATAALPGRAVRK